MFISSCAAPTLSPPEPCISHRGTPPAPAPDRARCRSGPGRNARSQRRPSTSMTATNGPSPPSPRSSARNVGTLIPVARATLPCVMPRARRAVRRISMSRIVCILGVRKQRMIYIGEGAISSGDRQFGRGADFRCSDDPIAQQRWTPTLSADQDRGLFCIAARRHRAQTEGCCKFTERQLRALIAAVRLVGGNPSSGHEIRWGTPLTYSTVRDSSRLRQIIVVTYLRRRRSSALRQHRSRTALPSSASRCGSSPYRRRFPHPAPACALQAFRLRALPDLARRRSS